MDQTSGSSESYWYSGLALKLTNIAAYALLGFSVYNAIGPNGAFLHGKTTYLTPTPSGFAVWIVIEALLAGMLLYQFTSRGKKLIIDGIGWLFPLLAIANYVYVNAWAHGHYVGAFLVVLILSMIVTSIYFIVRGNHESSTPWELVFVRLPFSIYHGWVAFLCSLTLFQALGLDASQEGAGFWTKFFIFLSLSSLQATSSRYSYPSVEGDVAGSIALTWTLFTIYKQQTSSGFIHISALVFTIFGVIGIVVPLLLRAIFYRPATALHDLERQPLIPNGGS